MEWGTVRGLYNKLLQSQSWQVPSPYCQPIVLCLVSSFDAMCICARGHMVNDDFFEIPFLLCRAARLPDLRLMRTMCIANPIPKLHTSPLPCQQNKYSTMTIV